MKVAEAALNVVPAVATRVAQSTEQKEVKDRITVGTPQQEAAIRSLRATVDPARAARIEEVVSAVRSGQYYPSPQQIAEKIVGEAELATQLRAILSK
jgi:anti-sigma28 factor (negative regulator of flagellin synthesis)